MTVRAFACLYCACTLLLGNGCGTTRVVTQPNHQAIAERYFSAIYGGDLSAIDALADKDIVVSYPIFQTVYNAPAIHGREAVKRFATHFCSRWTDAQFTIDEAVDEGDRLAIVWSFQARNVGAIRPGAPPDNQVHHWGGISLLRFNRAGQVVAEIGEESEPGPTARLKGGPVAR